MGSGGRSPAARSGEVLVSDLIFVLGTVVVFTVLALLVRGAERL